MGLFLRYILALSVFFAFFACSVGDGLQGRYERIAGEVPFITEDSILFAGATYRDEHWDRVKIHAEWNEEGAYARYNGAAWYRLHLDEKLSSIQNPVAFFPYSHGPYEVFLNGKRVYSSTSTSGSNVTARPPALVSLRKGVGEQAQQEVVMSIRSEARNGWGGFRGAIYIGELPSIQRLFLIEVIRVFSLSAISIFLFFYYGIFYFFRKDRKYLLYYSLFALALGLWLPGYYGFVLSIIPLDFASTFSTYWMGILMVPILIQFQSTFLKIRMGFATRAVQGIYLTIFGILAINMVVSQSIEFFNEYIYKIFMFMNLVSVALLVANGARAMVLKRTYAFWMMMGILVFVAAVIQSILAMEAGFFSGQPLMAEGFFFMSLVFAAVLAASFSHLNQMLEHANERLRTLDRLKDDFLATTSHELRTPLNGIQGIAEYLLARKNLQPDITSNIRLISSSASRLSRLVNDILDYERMRRGELQIKDEKVPLKDLSNYAIELVSPGITGRDLVIINRIHSATCVKGDSDRISQIIVNLLGNAVKFTENGSIILDAKREGKFVEFSIADTGIGIPKEAIGRVFDYFEQGEGGIARKYGGSGLGLSITKQLVELHGGEITVESVAGKGSTFYVRLPAADDCSHQPGLENWQQGVSSRPETDDFLPPSNQQDTGEFSDLALFSELDSFGSSLPGLDDPYLNSFQTENKHGTQQLSAKIIVVDDDPMNRDLLVKTLELEHFQVLPFERGQEAISRISSEGDVDLLIVDLMMPGMSGFDVIRKVRQLKNSFDLPAIILSARTRNDDLVEGLMSGANEFLAKPFQRTELVSRVNQLLEMKQMMMVQKSKIPFENRDLQTAQRIQTDVLNRAFSSNEFPGLDMDIRYMPRRGLISGDYYSVFQKENGSTGILLVDSSSHGSDAMWRTMQIDMVLRGQLEMSPGERLESVKEHLRGNVAGGQAISKDSFQGFSADIQPGRLIYSSSEYPVQFILRKDRVIPLKGTCSFEKPGSPVCGVDEIFIEPEDILFLYTDGLVSSASTAAPGDDSPLNEILELLARGGELRGRTSSEINEEILSRLHSAGSGQIGSEDVTVLSIRIKELYQ